MLLFDEPLSNLDAKLRRHVREEIREIQQKLGLTVVYVTHDQEEALAVSDRIIVMNNAVIAQDGTPRELYDAPANAFVADFIGEANIFDCEVEAVEDGKATVRLGPLTLQTAGRRRTGRARRSSRRGRAASTLASGRHAEHAARHARQGHLCRQPSRIRRRHGIRRRVRGVAGRRRAVRARDSGRHRLCRARAGADQSMIRPA